MELIRAAVADLEEAAALYQRAEQAMKEEDPEGGYEEIGPSAETLRAETAAGHLYIQRENGALAAAVALAPQQDPEYIGIGWTCGVQPGVIRYLAVDPGAQKSGLGGGVMDDALQLLRGMGCDCVRCDTDARNGRAVRLLEKMGFRECGEFRREGCVHPFRGFDKPLKRETPLLPIRMTPAFRGGKLTPWGGEKLKTVWGKDLREIPTGESLEVSCIPGLESRDPLGRTLTELIREFGEKIAGRYADKPFPLLLKLIDAREALSVQVHPNDAYAAEKEGGKLGKTEAWLILDTPPGGGELVYGIKPGTTLGALREASREGKAVEKLLRRVRVQAGDVCYIPAGCVHAIGAGITLYEIQQSSDITYRFYDWDRTDSEGRRRELHLEKGLDVTDLKLLPMPVRVEKAYGGKRILKEQYFMLDVIRTDDSGVLPPIHDFGMMTVLEGQITLRWKNGRMKMRKGETCFLPRSLPEVTLRGKGAAAVSMPG
ncbi:MAG: GNAT family N-acetyltransferase [Clostridia bacterium]|nr:GNAT family N-acetyltransferase [Clostridia bacterium]